ncbi:hypothetical protein Nepgr_027970 [Nepenthes gracilis]|uniref:Uncharacterized protein n=1 Tax=Nepenthes gracilis TaxID=150966 RepID=A0AAD3Y1P9_NEPGR|nr:hypothetical protein Nepgr_027970 [Nepenthes gracilis]
MKHPKSIFELVLPPPMVAEAAGLRGSKPQQNPELSIRGQAAAVVNGDQTTAEPQAQYQGPCHSCGQWTPDGDPTIPNHVDISERALYGKTLSIPLYRYYSLVISKSDQTSFPIPECQFLSIILGSIGVTDPQVKGDNGQRTIGQTIRAKSQNDEADCNGHFRQFCQKKHRTSFISTIKISYTVQTNDRNQNETW